MAQKNYFPCINRLLALNDVEATHEWQIVDISQDGHISYIITYICKFCSGKVKHFATLKEMQSGSILCLEAKSSA